MKAFMCNILFSNSPGVDREKNNSHFHDHWVIGGGGVHFYTKKPTIINGGINRGNAQPVARRTIFGERSEQLRRTILASEASRSENDFGERNEVYSIHRKYLVSEASRSENSFGECSAVLFSAQLRGKPLSFYFSKNPNLLGGGLPSKNFKK